MASPVLHIKDGYFFEVPKALWRADYDSMQEVPEFLREAHPEATLEQFNKAMDGKVLIPQPFGTLKNLHDKESGFCISKFMILELLAATLLVLIFTKIARKVQSGERPKGRFWNMFEAVLVFVRDEMAKPAIGDHDYKRFVPLLWTVFFFILTCNLFGLIPWMGSPTGTFGVTIALAAIMLCVSIGSGIWKFGPIGFWGNFIPHMDLPWYLFPLKMVIVPMIFVIEVIGVLIKHGVLGVRLLANMVAGHLVLLGIMGMISGAATAATSIWATTTFIAVIASTLFSIFELGVAFLQAYVFTFLAALFIGSSVHKH